jgi:hypothetical protein
MKWKLKAWDMIVVFVGRKRNIHQSFGMPSLDLLVKMWLIRHFLSEFHVVAQCMFFFIISRCFNFQIQHIAFLACVFAWLVKMQIEFLINFFFFDVSTH